MALSPDLTGYHEDLLAVVPLWDIERSMVTLYQTGKRPNLELVAQQRAAIAEHWHHFIPDRQFGDDDEEEDDEVVPSHAIARALADLFIHGGPMMGGVTMGGVTMGGVTTTGTNIPAMVILESPVPRQWKPPARLQLEYLVGPEAERNAALAMERMRDRNGDCDPIESLEELRGDLQAPNVTNR